MAWQRWGHNHCDMHLQHHHVQHGQRLVVTCKFNISHVQPSCDVQVQQHQSCASRTWKLKHKSGVQRRGRRDHCDMQTSLCTARVACSCNMTCVFNVMKEGVEVASSYGTCGDVVAVESYVWICVTTRWRPRSSARTPSEQKWCERRMTSEHAQSEGKGSQPSG